MSYRRTGWRVEETDTLKSGTSQTKTSKSFDYSIIPKIIFNIGLFVSICFMITMCRVDSKTIAQCQASCEKRLSTSQMKKVTSYSCICMAADRGFKLDSPWVLP